MGRSDEVTAKVSGITAAFGGLRGIVGELFSLLCRRRAASVRPPAATVEM
ncbi:UNVERIFIED_CONTAM: hypothetical protein Slati_0866400 [Sesamum latifolium]|uniref:Uncharacterized protein n=1 Tax=Sesamum latifolium TaxID=2727402 RepID=A0AAW2XMI1_9LAMI